MPSGGGGYVDSLLKKPGALPRILVDAIIDPLPLLFGKGGRRSTDDGPCLRRSFRVGLTDTVPLIVCIGVA